MTSNPSRAVALAVVSASLSLAGCADGSHEGNNAALSARPTATSGTETSAATSSSKTGAGKNEGASSSNAQITLMAPAQEAGMTEHLGSGVQFVATPAAAQVTYMRLSDGFHMGSASEQVSRPALSLIKLYLAAYVLEKGSLEEKYEALSMVSNSSDVNASDLFDRYPRSITEIAREYDLKSTRSADEWGLSVTSTYDVAKFLVQLLEKDPTNPILVAMSQSKEKAEDGYSQDFGTATLDNVIGSKWGWSDDRSLHSSASFGKDFVVVAAVTGSAQDLTDYVHAQVSPSNLKGASDAFAQQKAGTAPTPTLLEPSKNK